VGKCWGLGSDTPKDPGPWVGEQRNMWKPTQQDGLWFHGGNLHCQRQSKSEPKGSAKCCHFGVSEIAA
jgi:cation diffusion facilitator CzcD-associated flavoprotein CzcO